MLAVLPVWSIDARVGEQQITSVDETIIENM
jgi:hypothetical protein